MCNFLIAVFRGKFAEAFDLGEKEKLESPGVGGVQRPPGIEIPGWSKVKNLPWGGGGELWGMEPHISILVP